ncbi:MAG: InlB B-repeat-containing protein [Lachnospiraceae bacterium]|nr:InlB B-repeat-containing protein [Lachnospiraceae bacterium]
MKRKTKRLLSLLLALVMVLGLMPMTPMKALAANIVGRIDVYVPTPVAGTTVHGWYECQTENVYVDYFGWTPTHSTFLNEQEYTLNMKVKPEESYQLSYQLEPGGNVNPANSSAVYINGERATIVSQDAGHINVTFKMTAKQDSEIETKNVTLNTNGGTIAAGKNVTQYTLGTSTVLPGEDDITKPGYTFQGWFPNEDYIAVQKVEKITPLHRSDITLYACWTEGEPLPKIPSVSITGLDAPKGGCLPDTTAVAGSETYTITDISWWPSGGGTMLGEHNFAPSTGYQVRVYVEPAEGYRLASEAAMTASIDGKNATIIRYDGETTGMLIAYDFPVKLEITGIDAPTIGGSPDITATTGNDKFIVDSIDWFRGNTMMGEEEVFTYNTTYRVAVSVKPELGYELPAQADLTASINGNDAEVTRYNGSTVGAIISYTFQAIPRTATIIMASEVSGTVGSELELNELKSIVIKLTNESFHAYDEVEDVSSWFSNLPSGVTAKTTGNIGDGATMVGIAFYGTPIAASSGVMQITIPGAYLTSGEALTVTENPNAKFAIASVPGMEYPITVTGGKAAIGTETVTKSVKDKVITLIANAPATGKVFDKWVVESGSVTIANVNASTTTFTMPEGAVSIKATYKDAPIDPAPSTPIDPAPSTPEDPAPSTPEDPAPSTPEEPSTPIDPAPSTPETPSTPAAPAIPNTGWYTTENGQKVYYKDGSIAKNQWCLDNKQWYYVNENGAPLTGWQEIGGTWYYFYDDGSMAESAWVGDCYLGASGVWVENPVPESWMQSGSKWWYQLPDGTYAQSTWKKIGGDWYYFDKDGWMSTGWTFDGSDWYYMNASGTMKTGWFKDGASWYYLKPSGVMATGWVSDGSTWYYMDASGAMKTGWLQDGGNWYYLLSSGAMAHDTVIDGYKLATSGEWVQ